MPCPATMTSSAAGTLPDSITMRRGSFPNLLHSHKSCSWTQNLVPLWQGWEIFRHWGARLHIFFWLIYCYLPVELSILLSCTFLRNSANNFMLKNATGFFLKCSQKYLCSVALTCDISIFRIKSLSAYIDTVDCKFWNCSKSQTLMFSSYFCHREFLSNDV